MEAAATLVLPTGEYPGCLVPHNFLNLAPLSPPTRVTDILRSGLKLLEDNGGSLVGEWMIHGCKVVIGINLGKVQR